MKRLFFTILLFLSLTISAKENWIISTSLEFPYFAGTFSPGVSIKADAILFPWNLDEPDRPDGYGISLETGLMVPIRKQYSGLSPYFKLGLVGRKDLSPRISVDFKGHISYVLLGKNLPGNGLKPHRLSYFQNIGGEISSSFIYRIGKKVEIVSGLTLGAYQPLQGTKGWNRPCFKAGIHVGCGYSIG